MLRYIVFALLCFLSLQPANATKLNVHEFTLANGLHVLLIPNHTAPVVSHILWYNVGSADDPMGKSGLAHYVEHMLFRGTERYPDGEYSEIISSLGGVHNAFTARDYTGYYVTIAKQHLPKVMELEADRMQHLAASDDAFKFERNVVLEERHVRVESHPNAILAEAMNHSLWRHHPYRRPIGGYSEEINSLTKQDVMVFYRRYYQPANTFLVVSGDITLEELKPLVQTHYGNVKTAFKPERRWVKEPPQQTYRKVVFTHKAVEQPGFRRTYQAPSLNDGNKELAIPSMLLAQLVGNGLTSYLYQTLVEEQAIATSAEAYYSGFSLGPGSFTIHVIPSRETSLSTIENAVEDALETFKATLIDDEDLVRAQTILKAESVYTRDGLEQLARILGTLHAIGLDQLFFHNWNDTIEAVTAEHIQAAAKHIFKRNHSVTGFLLPEDTQ